MRVALIPAAGVGNRFGDDVPKQYALLAGKPLLQQTIDALARGASPSRVFVVLAREDRWYDERIGRIPGVVPLRCGGTTRAQSVLNGLNAIEAGVVAEDWVLVHDAVRPCIAMDVLHRLLTELEDEPVGGLLATPLSDTLKRVESGGALRCVSTEPRGGLWQAQTPQMFRYAFLRHALGQADLNHITDESQAIESLGVKPRLVAGDPSNIKVTQREDLALAEAILASRAGHRFEA